ncbi:MAG: hypothetical protein OEW44_00055 [Gemmatimonadota bacterium]|nr:hypothetical protein [Gemmatimonadota bacterium]
MNITDRVRSALAGWDPNGYTLRELDTQRARVNLGLDLISTSAASGGNAASCLVNTLADYGLVCEPSTWQHLWRGGSTTVTRTDQYSTPVLARLLYGPDGLLDPELRRSRLGSAAAWARRRALLPTNPGFAPAMWSADRVDSELGADRRDRRGNRTTRE